MNVLCVEDYELSAALMRDTFRRHAPDVHLEFVSTVEQALARLTSFEQGLAEPSHPESVSAPRYDVVLTDLNLPDGDGLEILSYVRSHALSLAVVMLSGSGQQESVIGALRAGANDYVIKRDNYLAVLPDTLRGALERFRSETARASNPLKVLYADADSADIERIRIELYRLAPHIQIESVHTAQQVLARLSPTAPGTAPDVLLLDFQLPGMPVLELLKDVRDVAGAALPVVLVTGKGDERIAQLAMRLQVADYLSKGDGYLQRLPLALESAHMKAVGARERAALRNSERDFHTLVDTLPAVIARFDRGGRYLYASPAIKVVTGLPPAHFIGKTLAEVGASSTLVQQFDVAFRAVLDTGVRQQIEIEAETFVGRRQLDLTLVPELAADGSIPTVVTISHDITERKRAADMVRESDLLARSTIDALSAHMSILDERGTIIFVNRAWRSFAANNGVVGSRAFEGDNYLAVCDAASAEEPLAGEIAAGVRAVMRAEADEFTLEYPCHSPDEQRWFNARVTRFTGDGPLRVVIAHENITERKKAEAARRESEELFGALFENSSDAILVSLLDGSSLVANPSACRMFQRTATELFSGGNLFLDMNNPRTLRAMAEFAASGEWRGELGLLRKDGSTFEAELTSNSYEDSGGLGKACTVIRDITERKIAEAQVASQSAELVRANQALTMARNAIDSANFLATRPLANPSHKIGSLIRSIIGRAQPMQSETSDDKPRDHLGGIQQAADDLLRSVSDLLDRRKTEGGDLDLGLADAELRRTLTRAVDMLQAGPVETDRATGGNLRDGTSRLG